MRTTPRFSSRLVLALVALAMARPIAAIQVEVVGDGVEIDGQALRFPIPESELVKALGEPGSINPPAGDAYSNRVLNWPELGVVAFSHQKTSTIHSLKLIVRRPMYWKDSLFTGTVWVDGSPLPSELDPQLLTILGFVEGTFWKREYSCTYVGVTTVANQLETFELGLKSECDPDSPFKKAVGSSGAASARLPNHSFERTCPLRRAASTLVGHAAQLRIR